MSNIYIQEPPTKGKVLLVTSVGEIDIELWSKEAPKACRNFVQLCMEGYYDGTIFHRVVKDFIVQGGDPTGTGTGGMSVYGEPFKDEFHSRLRFVRRGLVAMANAGPNDNGSQFFFTMGQTPELQNKHTIFGKVTGQTLYNILKLQEVETDDTERPLYPHKIIKSEILSNPFDDIVPRVVKKAKKDKQEDKKVRSKSKATKNFSLLSFGEEAEEDEEQTHKASKKFSGKSKSSHDLIDDPRLSSVPVVDSPNRLAGKRKAGDDEVTPADVRTKLKKTEESKEGVDIKSDNELRPPTESPEKKEIEKKDVEKKESKSDQARREAKKLQKELIKASKKREKALKEDQEKAKEALSADEKPSEDEKNEPSDDFLENFKMERKKYMDLKKMQNKKGKGREDQTLALLGKFISKLLEVKQQSPEHPESDEAAEEDEADEEDINDLSWMRHRLNFQSNPKRRVLDANVDDSERYEIHDPRNPVTQRRREAGKKKSKNKK